jgi:hypothetical protein
MNATVNGVEPPIKYTKESLAGLRDAWWTYGKAVWVQYSAAIEQLAGKLPAPLKKKTPSSTSSSANAPS